MFVSTYHIKNNLSSRANHMKSSENPRDIIAYAFEAVKLGSGTLHVLKDEKRILSVSHRSRGLFNTKLEDGKTICVANVEHYFRIVAV